MGNKIVHWELMGPDGGAMAGFYKDMFGWESEPVPGFDGYHMVDGDHAGLGGAVGKGSEEMPAYLTMYIEVASINEHLAKIEAAGGGTVVPRTVVPDMVVFAMFADPAGNLVGLVEQDTPA
ncbi:MAG: VOC family protein [Acidimicrobiia bacterium]|nr:VOC family protein [Acidimicrobiia bacterium]